MYCNYFSLFAWTVYIRIIAVFCDKNQEYLYLFHEKTEDDTLCM